MVVQQSMRHCTQAYNVAPLATPLDYGIRIAFAGIRDANAGFDMQSKIIKPAVE
jgi:hypothetical protein